MPFVTVDEVTSKAFDYIVIGGGTAGLTAAVRLAEDPSVSVLVLEAGKSENFEDPIIEMRAEFPKFIGNPQYDWAFKTIPQKHANGTQVLWTRGKVLGGTSAVNGSLWSKPAREHIDAFEKLGNAGWNWEDYHGYSKKSETVHLAGKEQTSVYPHTYTGEHGGRSGPIQVTIGPSVHTLDKLFQETMVNKGLKRIDDPYGGDITGTWIGATNLDPQTWKRSYSANAYLWPNIGRHNLSVLTNALVSRVIFDNAKDGERIATGVELIYGNGTFQAKVNKEVVLSAGTIKSPHILELSGIGNPTVLSKIDVDVLVDLPGVGENLQDHSCVLVHYELSSDQAHETLDLLNDAEYAAKAKELHAVGGGLYRSGITSVAFFPLSAVDPVKNKILVDKLEADVDTAAKTGKLALGLEEQLRLQISAFRNDAVPDCEIIIYPGLFSRKLSADPGKRYVSIMLAGNHPVSRGTIHAASNDPTVHPVIDPHYLENDFDTEVILQELKFVRSMREVEPWKSGIVRELLPGSEVQSDADLKEYIRDNIATVWHACGSCSMLPRDKQGVVDPRLKVYGTRNLRIADISVLPLQISAHTQATAYVIGEKGSQTALWLLCTLTMPFTTVDNVIRKTFDYVVIGGGTAGLAAAVRLSEDPSVSVLVLEAGARETFEDPNIDIPGQYGKIMGNPQYDWCFMTTKQKNANDSEQLWTRGKVLGGTSAVNFYVWSKPPAADIDAFEKLGNQGWNWQDYHKYSKKSETVHIPAKEQTDLYPHTFTAEHGGKSGPIQVTIPPHIYTIDKLFQETLTKVGLKKIDDPYGGDITGTWMAASNLNPETWTRCYAATAYLRPNIGRPNLHVLTNALVSRILFDDAKHGNRRATSVEFLQGGAVFEVKLNKEALICAGTIKSPQILELSGIGQPDILSKIGVDVVVNLPGVGENVQEHVLVAIPYELSSNQVHDTLDLLLNPEYAAKARELHAAGKGLFCTGITSAAFFPLSAIKSADSTSLIDALEAEVNAAARESRLAPGLEEQLRLQISALRDDSLPDCEVIVYPGLFARKVTPEPGKSYVTPTVCLNHPVSRGTIHADSKDPSSQPVIDPHYFENKFDLELLVQGVKFVRSLTETEPWKSGIFREISPGPECQTDDEIKEFIKNTFSSVWHTCGSCSMLPRNKGGVVDPRLKVYGTTNVRVADLSIVPLHICAHTQATAYVVGEKVADFIKADKPKEVNYSGPSPICIMPFITVDDARRKAFDYVIVGGGPAGLSAAARLSEDASVTVLVLEAGASQTFEDPNIDIPLRFLHVLGNPQYDWCFITEKQKHANNNQTLWTRGKRLGGSTTINSYVWSKPSASDIDAWEKLGNPGWNWKDYHEYSKKSETVHLPGKEQTDLYPHTFTAQHTGKSGPVQASIAPHVHTIDKLFQETMINKGLKRIDDPHGGDITGAWIAASSLDPKTWTRCHAAKAYLQPNISRENLNVLTDALVSRVILSEPHDGNRTATGVEFIHGGTSFTAKANNEVILCAGAIKSPHILELSGIGRSDVLSRIGVDVAIDLPGVGENVQDHIFVAMPHELSASQVHETLDLLHNPEYAAKAVELHAQGKGLLRTGMSSAAWFPLSASKSVDSAALIDKLEADINAAAKNGQLSKSLEEQYRLQIAALRDDSFPDCEVMLYPGLFSFKDAPEPGKSYVTPVVSWNHPISRGTIHAASNDATIQPVIDPHYLENDFDLEMLIQHMKFVRSMRDTEPWKSGIVREVLPGPDYQSDDDLREYIKSNLLTMWHTAGSCSMLPREKQGVVDPKLKVYGTSNLRIADLSIIPLIISVPTQATAYVIGEKVADLIKAEHAK
ncbi:hypothetical protein CVT26_005470 [Gymnopilus dilepis]|uniref:pyranose dehydrogenase (acceptor) n=1 Tax=Gymnopilus dilepis TaxID=231916 RepID=A0A409YT75_9AGAR|nr:hypothetical protein CVT26_005470 [Gymnopilus dilepis]